ncbi:MAG: hypothetical protein OJF52_000702 [Nitrospira sp.]|jgi:hypothetical protein|nr:MAG: hypothetical protein OJF52_000702 [Nitrospira sp.]
MLRPSITLGIPGDPYTLFYDYDQIEGKKLGSLTSDQKVIWFRERLNMTHMEPLRRIWKDSEVFEKLLHSKLDPNARCSFSIAAMALMLGVVEALGTFRNPVISRSNSKSKNKKAFLEFLTNHMGQWNVVAPNTTASVADILWKSFRNGITHDLRVDQVSGADQLWGSLEFQENFSDPANTRFEKYGNLLRICPLAFFKDLDGAVKEYFGQLSSNTNLLKSFQSRFDEVYPSQSAHLSG